MQESAMLISIMIWLNQTKNTNLGPLQKYCFWISIHTYEINVTLQNGLIGL